DLVVRPRATDDERRRTAYAGGGAVAIVLLDRARVLAARQARVERGGVQAELRPELRQLVRCQRLLVLEQQIVHLPVLALIARAARRLRRLARIGVDVVDREVAEDVAHLAGIHVGALDRR